MSDVRMLDRAGGMSGQVVPPQAASAQVGPAIVSGGSGARLSRGSFPKRFWPLASEPTMVRQTARAVAAATRARTTPRGSRTFMDAREVVRRAASLARVIAPAVAVVVLGAAGERGEIDRGLTDWQLGRPAEAFEHWRQASLAGDARGALYIGTLFDTGRGVAPDCRQAMAWYARAAELGSAAGAFNVGVLYDSGLCVAGNPRAAASWYARAAAGGFGRGAYNLALMYEAGTGVPVDHARAMALYRNAAEHGITAARAHLVSFGRPVTSVVRSPPQDPAAKAFEQAQSVLLSRGPADAARMVALLQQAAEQHNSLAEYDLGYCYQRGMGLPTNAVQALSFYRRAAADASDASVRAIAQAGIDSLTARAGG